MTDKECEKLIKAAKKLSNFEKKHKLNNPNTCLSELNEETFYKWIKLTKKFASSPTSK